MAKLVVGILGGFSGKVGTVVGSIWKGIATIRAYVANAAQPNTPAQLEQRAKFSTVIGFLKTLTSFLRVGFKSYADGMSGFNAAMAYNLDNAIMGVYPTFEIDYSKALVSRGTLQVALNPGATSGTASQVVFNWDDNSGYANALATDTAMLVVYNPIKKLSETISVGNTRLSGAQTITLPESFSGDEVQCFIAFSNGKIVSNSLFAGTVIVA